jgi:protein subunit release factor A
VNRKLLFSVTSRDLDITYFSGTGAGGQFRNKNQNCVRISHKASGVLVTGQSSRSRKANTTEAFRNLTNNLKFKSWLSTRASEVLQGKTLEEVVKEMMSPENLKVECLVDDVWVECG